MLEGCFLWVRTLILFVNEQLAEIVLRLPLLPDLLNATRSNSIVSGVEPSSCLRSVCSVRTSPVLGCRSRAREDIYIYISHDASKKGTKSHGSSFSASSMTNVSHYVS